MEKERLSFEELEQELEEFKKEKEKVRRIIGRIGGKNQARITSYNVCYTKLLRSLIRNSKEVNIQN